MPTLILKSSMTEVLDNNGSPSGQRPVDVDDVKAALLGCKLYQFQHILRYVGKWVCLAEKGVAHSEAADLYGAGETKRHAIELYVEYVNAKGNSA